MFRALPEALAVDRLEPHFHKVSMPLVGIDQWIAVEETAAALVFDLHEILAVAGFDLSRTVPCKTERPRFIRQTESHSCSDLIRPMGREHDRLALRPQIVQHAPELMHIDRIEAGKRADPAR